MVSFGDKQAGLSHLTMDKVNVRRTLKDRRSGKVTRQSPRTASENASRCIVIDFKLTPMVGSRPSLASQILAAAPRIPNGFSFHAS